MMAKSLEEKKLVRYSVESLYLQCEWEDCTVIEEDIQNFISHLILEHLSKIDERDLHCHWKDCEGFTESLTELRRHILLHAFHTKIKCYGRNLQIRKKIQNCALNIHSRNIIPELPEPLVCCWENCLSEFECPEFFYRHADYHAIYDSRKPNSTSAVCLWQDCNRTFADQHKVKDHLRSHTQEKLIACPTCGGMFASRTKFFDHIQRQLISEDDPEGVYICEYCSRKMSSERLLRDHMRLHVNHYKCPYCDMTCPTPSGIQVHVAYRHSDNKPYSCQYCDYRCKSESDLRKHLETHSMIPTYKCPIEGCSYASRSHSCCSAHYRKKHEKKHPEKYACHLCEKICTRGNYLTKHLLNHHKFRWPSGHCRFRYRLHEDGYYRLQTVRYESLELSQTMMCDDSENIDDPNNVMPGKCPDGSSTFSSDKPHNSESAIQSTNSPVVSGSLLFCLENGNNVEFPQGASVMSEPLSNVFFQDPKSVNQEPVLIKIVDTTGRTLSDSTGSSLLLIKNPSQSENEQHKSFQFITEDSNGKMMIETAELVTEYDPSLEQPQT